MISVVVTPRASRTKLVGEHDGRLKIALAAPPVDGQANKALLEALAEWLEVRQAALELIDGATGRRKRVAVSGLSVEQATARLAVHDD